MYSWTIRLDLIDDPIQDTARALGFVVDKVGLWYNNDTAVMTVYVNIKHSDLRRITLLILKGAQVINYE
jgi:hypothetical protein